MGKPRRSEGFCKHTSAVRGWGRGMGATLNKSSFWDSPTSKKGQSLSGGGGGGGGAAAQPGFQPLFPPLPAGPILTHWRWKPAAPRVPEHRLQLTPGRCRLGSQTAWLHHLALPSLTGKHCTRDLISLTFLTCKTKTRTFHLLLI